MVALGESNRGCPCGSVAGGHTEPGGGVSQENVVVRTDWAPDRAVTRQYPSHGPELVPDGHDTRSARTRFGAASTFGPSAPVVRSGSLLPAARYLIVDDCTLHRENLAAVLLHHAESLPAVAWDLPSLCAALSAATSEIVLISMGTRDNVALLRLVRETCPEAKVIVVGISEDDEAAIVASAEAGVAGYHLKAESLDDLLAVISAVANGQSSCSPKISAILLKRLRTLAAQRQPESREFVLTAREVQILRLLEMGLSNRDIANQLCIALHTVKNHVHSVLGKLRVKTRAEAAAYSRSVGRSPLTSRDLGPEPV
jgi:DNA-binding NarL/FixJ family response regulator